MNKNIIRFIKNNWLLILFFYFVAFFGFVLGKGISVNAYSLNEKGNIVSDNLLDCNINDSLVSNGITYTMTNNGISVVGSTGGGNISCNANLEKNVKYKLSGGSNNVRIFVWNTSSVNWRVIAVTTGNDVVDFILNDESINNYAIQIIPNVNIAINELIQPMIVESDVSINGWEPFGTWLSGSNVDNLLANSLNISSVSASWNGGSISDASSYVYNKDGLVWVDGVFDYISGEVSNGYSDADVSVVFDTRMPTNVNYSYSFIDSIGSSISFYQGSTRIYSINVTDDINNLCSSVPTSNLCVINLADKIDVKQYTYFDKVVLWSSNYDHRPLSFGYYSSSFYSGYNKGYSNGYDVGYSNGSSSGYNNGYKRGYDIGFDAGILHQENNGPNTLVGLVSAIFSGPVTMFQTIFDFNFLGINLSQFFFSLISLLIVVWLVIKFL